MTEEELAEYLLEENASESVMSDVRTTPQFSWT